MGKALRLTIVAEGVETLEQKRFLDAHDCDQIQGFLFSKAVPAEDIPALLGMTFEDAPPLQPKIPVPGPAAVHEAVSKAAQGSKRF